MHFFRIAFSLLIVCVSLQQLKAQTDEDLVVYYSFDNGLLTDELNNSAAISQGSTIPFGCGVQGNALSLTGSIGAGVLIFGSEINNLFRIGDFTLSFYFKPNVSTGTLDIFSKQTECDPDSALSIRYAIASSTISCLLSENDVKSASIQQKLDAADCWHMITLIRDHTRTILYVDGEFQSQNSILSVINLSNDAPLAIAASPCIGTSLKPFKGLIDEIRIYDRALDPEEVAGLYFKPDKIANQDTIIYLGNYVETSLVSSCATSFEWSPTTGVANVTSPLTTITPVEAGTFPYILKLDDGDCVAEDTLIITVIDPSTLDCSEIYVPSAFTPNGDAINSLFGISNPVAIPELLSFEVINRWGNIVFATKDPHEKWDGSFLGQELNSGVYMYSMKWVCNNEELLQTGPVTIIR